MRQGLPNGHEMENDGHLEQSLLVGKANALHITGRVIQLNDHANIGG